VSTVWIVMLARLASPIVVSYALVRPVDTSRASAK
jgi:hypothetical protein